MLLRAQSTLAAAHLAAGDEGRRSVAAKLEVRSRVELTRAI
jgi:hypothetical protein